MSIQDLGNLGEFIGSIAVLASLLYLALQVSARRPGGNVIRPLWIERPL